MPNSCQNMIAHRGPNCLQAVLPMYLVSAHLWYSGRGFDSSGGVYFSAPFWSKPGRLECLEERRSPRAGETGSLETRRQQAGQRWCEGWIGRARSGLHSNTHAQHGDSHAQTTSAPLVSRNRHTTTRRNPLALHTTHDSCTPGHLG